MGGTERAMGAGLDCRRNLHADSYAVMQREVFQDIFVAEAYHLVAFSRMDLQGVAAGKVFLAGPGYCKDQVAEQAW